MKPCPKSLSNPPISTAPPGSVLYPNHAAAVYSRHSDLRYFGVHFLLEQLYVRPGSLLQRYYYATYRDLSVYFLFQRRLGRYHVRFRGYYAAYYHYFLLPPALYHHRTYCGRRQGLIRRQIKSILYGVNQT